MTSTTSTATFPKPGTRQAEFFDHLKGSGASVETLSTVMNWQPHSVRAALTGLRKRGLQIERILGKTGEAPIYRVRMAAAGRRRRAKQ